MSYKSIEKYREHRRDYYARCRAKKMGISLDEYLRKKGTFRGKRLSDEERVKRLKERKKKYRDNPEHKKQQKERLKNWRKNNPDYMREYLEKNKGKYRETRKISSINCMHRRRSMMVDTDITIGWLKNLYEKATICILCGKVLNGSSQYPDNKELDHIVPICIGGKHTMDNVRYICGKCNRNRPRDGSDLIVETGEQSE